MIGFSDKHHTSHYAKGLPRFIDETVRWFTSNKLQLQYIKLESFDETYRGVHATNAQKKLQNQVGILYNFDGRYIFYSTEEPILPINTYRLINVFLHPIITL